MQNSSSNIAETIRREFARRKIVVVGDLVADQFLHGKIARVSREAPVFILRHEQTATSPGGAANAAANVASLGGKACLVGLVGRDPNGEALLKSLQSANVDCAFVAVSEKFQTTTKVRVLASQHYAARQQVIRIDYENAEAPAADLISQLRENLLAAAEDADAIVVSDYEYGVAGREIAALAVQISSEKKIPLLVDSRYRLPDFTGATSATPNQEEAEQIIGEKFAAIENLVPACAGLRERLGYQSLLVTCGNRGMILVENDQPPLHLEAVGSKEPVDVTGAGDTVIAAYALGLASGLSFAESARLANYAGGIVVMKKGTAAVGAEELIASLERQDKSADAADSANS